MTGSDSCEQLMSLVREVSDDAVFCSVGILDAFEIARLHQGILGGNLMSFTMLGEDFSSLEVGTLGLIRTASLGSVASERQGISRVFAGSTALLE
jgi:hypothetical protein